MDTGEALVSVDGMPENGGALPADSASMLGIMVIEAAMVARMDKALYEVLTSDAGMSHDGAVGIIVAVRQKVND